MLTLPLILMALAAVEFARAMFEYHVLVKSTRDAVRLLSGFDPATPSEYPSALAINRVVYGQDVVGTPLLPSLTTSMVRICHEISSTGCTGAFANINTGSSTVNIVRVQVENYQFRPLFGANIIPQITFGPIGTTMMAVR